MMYISHRALNTAFGAGLCEIFYVGIIKTVFTGSSVSQEFCGEKNTKVDGTVI